MFTTSKAILIVSFVFYILIGMVGCGADDSKEKAAEEYDQQAKVDGEDDEKEVVLEYRRAGERMALAVDDTKDVPECESLNDRQLVYVKKTDEFFSCEDGEWLEVDLKGPKGDPGEPAPIIADNMWQDPITEEIFLIAGNAKYPDAQSACAGDYRLPSLDEATTAVLHGLGGVAEDISGIANMWTSTNSADYDYRQLVVTFNNGSYIHQLHGVLSGIICIKDAQ
jgi:hypothetical protein